MIKGALNAASSCISPILLAVEGFLCSDYWTFITYNYCDRIYSMMRIIRKRQSGSGEPLKPFISCANLIQSRLPCISFSSRMFSGHWYTGRCSSLRVNQLPNSCSGRYLFWLFPLCIEIVHFVGNLYWPFTSKQELQNPLPGENGGKRGKKKPLLPVLDSAESSWTGFHQLEVPHISEGGKWDHKRNCSFSFSQQSLARKLYWCL